jgi:HSP20 family molecular chaperone IbpA
MNKHTCSLCAWMIAFSMPLCSSVPTIQRAEEENAYRSPFKQMSEFFDEFDKVFSQHMQDLEKRMSDMRQEAQHTPHQQPRFSIRETLCEDGSQLIITTTLPGFTMKDIQVKFVTTEEEGVGMHKTLEISAQHQPKEAPKTAEKAPELSKDKQRESIVHTHHMYASSSYENGRNRNISCEDGKVKIQYDLPDNVNLEGLNTAQEASYIVFEKDILSIKVPVLNKK